MAEQILCACGCGRPAPIAKQNDPRFGHVKGEPVRYICGHATAKSGARYLVEDAGYDTPCWTWQGAMAGVGYGAMYAEGRTRRAHRVFYERAKGPIPDGLDLDHLCRNRACVNPDHLEPVTRAENQRRGLKTRLDARCVEEIRDRLAAGQSQTAIALEFGVTKHTIYDIAHGRSWRAA